MFCFTVLKPCLTYTFWLLQIKKLGEFSWSVCSWRWVLQGYSGAQKLQSVTNWWKRTPALRSDCSQVSGPMYVVQSGTDLHCLQQETILHSNTWFWPLAMASLRAASDQPAAGVPNTGMLCPQHPLCWVALARLCSPAGCPAAVCPTRASCNPQVWDAGSSHLGWVIQSCFAFGSTHFGKLGL